MAETHDFFLYLLIILLTAQLFGTMAVASLLLVQAFGKPHVHDVALVFVATLFLLMGIIIVLLNT